MTPELPFVTADLPGSGGTVRATPEDFRVDEVPAYLPSGAGPHLYVRIEKRGRTTRDAVRALAGALGVAERDAGFAGMKDKDAVTTQWLSFPVARDPDPASLAGPGIRVLEVSRHANKLRTGHGRAPPPWRSPRAGSRTSSARSGSAARGGTPPSGAPSSRARTPRRSGAPRATASCAGSPSPRTSRSCSTAGSRSGWRTGCSPRRSG